jgi:tetratricopeptide (TPR) repeat protein
LTLTRSLAIDRALAAADPENSQPRANLSASYRKIGDVLREQGHLTEALEYYKESLSIAEDRLSNSGPGNANWTVDVIGGLAYDFLLTRDFITALSAADKAVSLAPNEIWLYINRAHALMFLGHTAEARAIYLQYRDRTNVQDGKSWVTVVLMDFAELRKAGLTNPLMDEIENQFSPRP